LTPLKKARTAPEAPKDVADVAMFDYSTKTEKLQKETLTRSYGVAVSQIKDMQMPTGNTPFTVVDLGAADGPNTVPLFKDCVKAVRERDAARPIVLVFEDQPCNDFSKITQMDPTSWGKKVFPMVNNIGFFDPTMPEGSVHLSFSSFSMHYLAGGPPCNFKTTGLKDTDAVGKEKAMFAAAAEKDWERLLLARASELAPGGRCVIANLCVDESTGWYPFSTDLGASLYTTISDCLRSMVKDCLMTEHEFEWATSPEYYRTIAEHKKPFEDPESLVRKAGLVLKSADVQVCRCPLKKEYEAGEYASAEEYGKAFASLVQAFSYNKCMRAFKSPENKRPQEEQRKLIDEVYHRLAKRITDAPLTFGYETVALVMVIEKAV